jgi:predicted TIM-barrel fold metal-dependent hydrolase
MDRIIDLDQHDYEADDCCTRHVEAGFAERVPHPRPGASGEREWVAGDRHVAFERWVRDVTLAPGAMHAAIASQATGGTREVELVATDTPDFRSPARRLELLDGWGIDATLMLPSALLGFDAELTDDVEAASATMRAFNRWVEDDWGFVYEDRLVAPPFLSFLDVDAAVDELERVLAAGARMVLVGTGPVDRRSPADPFFDPVGARIPEAGLPVALPVSASGYEAAMSRLWGEDPRASHRSYSAFQWYVGFAVRAITDTLAAFVLHNLFGRFPGLRILSVEQGSLWVEPLLRDLDLAWGFVAGRPGEAAWVGGPLTEVPSEVLRRHLFVAPYLTPGYDAPVPDLVDLLGADRVIFGSDWPHGEGRASPLDDLDGFAPLRPSDRARVLAGNAAELLNL